MAIALTVSGFATIIAKFIILRELLLLCKGNIFLYAIPFSIWFISFGIGILAGNNFVSREGNPYKAYMYIQLLTSLILVAAIVSAKVMIIWLDSPLPPHLLTAVAMVTIMPLSSLIGTLFSFGKQIITWKRLEHTIHSIVLTIAGIIVGPLMILFLNPVQSSGIAGVLMGLSSVFIYKNFVMEKGSANLSRLVLFALVVSINLILIYPYGTKIYTLNRDITALHGTRNITALHGTLGR
jgi:hypothetical protein